MPVITMDFTARQREFVVDVFFGEQRQRSRSAITAESLMHAKRIACELAHTLISPVAVIIYNGSSMVRSIRELPAAVLLRKDIADKCAKLSVA